MASENGGAGYRVQAAQSYPQQEPAAGPPEGRLGAFTTPYAAGDTAGLARAQMAYNESVPRSFRPSSLLTPINYSRNPGGNGMSSDQAARRFPDGTPMGNPNGISESSFQQAAMLRLSGQDDGIN
jgi:hypothetical protein